MRLILASASERRKELLSWLGIPFEVRISGFDEDGFINEDVRMLVGGLAQAKAQVIVDQLKQELAPMTKLEKEISPPRMEQTLVLGADTVVVVDGEVIGKPKDIDHAREILVKLRDRSHEVYCGVTLIDVLTGKVKTGVDESRVTFRDYSNQEIEDYLATSEPLGKAGAYMILGGARKLVDKVEGSITGVTGLPLYLVAQLLNEFGVAVKVDVAGTIRRKTGYNS